MDFILGFVSALCLVGVFFLGAFYGIHITRKEYDNKDKCDKAGSEVEDGNDD